MTENTQDILIVLLIILAIVDVIKDRLGRKIEKMKAELKERGEQ